MYFKIHLRVMISVIISIYKNLDNLDLILQGLERQSYKDFEVVVSEDNNAKETLDFLEKIRLKHNFRIKHVCQEDIGFRKTKILNQAVLISEGEYLVFLDGDCVPHKHLLKSYIKHLTPNTVCMGKRCALKKGLTERLVRKHRVGSMNMFYLMLNSLNPESGLYIPWEKPKNNYRLILGCNFAIPRQLLIDINGFDEDYTFAGVGEDHDIDWRLRKKGVEFLNIKHTVIVYHLYHKENYSDRETLAVNLILKEKLKHGEIFCRNGIEKLSDNPMNIQTEIELADKFIEESKTDNIDNNEELKQKVFAEFPYYSDENPAFKITLIKNLNILEQYNKYNFDPCKEMIIISSNSTDSSEKITSLFSDKYQLLIIDETFANGLSFKDKVSFFAHSKFVISDNKDDIGLSTFLRTPVLSLSDDSSIEKIRTFVSDLNKN